MIKEFLTYFPKWMPVKSRQEFLEAIKSSYWAEHVFHMMLALRPDENIEFSSADAINARNRAYLVFAYARMRTTAFCQSEDAWQYAAAQRIARTVDKSIRINGPSMRTTWYDQVKLDFELAGMHKTSRKMHFNWVEMQGTVDTAQLWHFLENRIARLESVYSRKIADRRYGFATRKSCPIPRCQDDLDDMAPFQVGLVLEVLMRVAVSRWSIQAVRNYSVADIYSTVYSNEQDRASQYTRDALLLKPALLRAVRGTSELTQTLNDLVAMTFQEMLTPDATLLLWQRPPTTVIQALDKITEEAT